MRRLFLTGGLALLGMGLFAQSLDKAKDLLKSNKIADAKTEIDKVVATDKGAKNAEAWFYKMKIYDAIANNDQLKGQYPDARETAFEALKKYYDTDEKDKPLMLLKLENFKTVQDIYSGFFQAGASQYNTGHYDSAYNSFSGAIRTSTYMNDRGWLKLPLDTTSTLYAGISAEKAGKKDSAAVYYGRIADAKIHAISGTNMIDIYKWLVDYYNNKKDAAQTNHYLALGKAQFPDDLFWPEMELDNARASGNKDSLFAKYDEITTKFTKNHLFFFNYGLELYQYASDTTSGHRPANYEALTAKAQEMLKKCLEIQPDYPQAALVLGQISYNQGVDLQAQTKKIPGKGPEDVKKRADLRVAATKKFDEAIPYFEQVDKDLGSKGKLKQEEKGALKDAYDLLISIYEQRSTAKDKVDLYTNKFNNVDKDH